MNGDDSYVKRPQTSPPVASSGGIRTQHDCGAVLLSDATGKVLEVAPVVAGTEQLGYPESVIRPLGVILLLCVITYVIPRVSMVGAVLLTGYLGGAIATHVRVGSPLLTHVLFPTYVAAFVWMGLWLRDARPRRLIVPQL
jgi:hypothetical protein